ncbi:MAG: Bax inhibitor-1/YccA family protein [Pseudomonadota bacterium]
MMAFPQFGSPLNGRGALAALPALAPGEAPATSAGAAKLIALHFAGMAAVVAVMWSFFEPNAGLDRTAMEDARNVGFGAGVVAFAAAIGGRLRPQYARVLAPAFALFGGLFIGGLTIAAEFRFPGIAVQTTTLTACVFLAMYAIYVTKIIKLTDQLKAAIAAAAGGIGLVFLVSFALLLLFDIRLGFIHGSGSGAVLWFGFVALIAAMNLLVDFERIDRLDQRRAPKVAEWHAALALMTSFVWLYLSILRMLRNVRR